MSDLQPHIKCKPGDLRRNVLLPGDPARVIKISKFLDNPTKVCQNREYLSYNGSYNGVEVSAISTGIGCPSTLIAMEELDKIGVKNFIRVGTCGILKHEAKAGDLIIPISSIKSDGEMLGHDLKNTPIEADSKITRALIKAAEKLGVTYHTGVNRTHDSFYESTEEFLKLKGKDIVSSEMECAAVYLVAKLKNLRAGCVLVANTWEPPEEVEKNPKIVYSLSNEDAVKKGMDKAIKVALEALFILENENNSREG